MTKEEKANEEAFALVESMLHHLHKREDHTELMNSLRYTFVSAGNMFRADRYALECLGMRKLDAFLFGRIMELTRYIQRTSYGEKPKVNRLLVASPYLAANFFGMREEHFYLFCVNHHGKLKKRVLVSKGTEFGALFDVHRLLLETLRESPAAIFIAHNHPGGTLRPSPDDIQCTLSVMVPLTMMGIPLLDHLIVTGRNVVSMRQNGFIPECEWMAQDPKNHFLRDWLMTDEEAEKRRRKRKPSSAKKKE